MKKAIVGKDEEEANGHAEEAADVKLNLDQLKPAEKVVKWDDEILRWRREQRGGVGGSGMVRSAQPYTATACVDLAMLLGQRRGTFTVGASHFLFPVTPTHHPIRHGWLLFGLGSVTAAAAHTHLP